MQKAKADEMRYGDIYQTFIEQPVDGRDVNMKHSLSVLVNKYDTNHFFMFFFNSLSLSKVGFFY